MAYKVLIIDDDTDLCTLLARFLQKNSFETDTMYSGLKGLAAYKEGSYDAVICDYRLGDMDGIRLVKELRAINPQACILVITGYSDIKTAVEVIKLGAFDYITKPLIPDEVLAILQKLVTQNGSCNEPAAILQSPKARISQNGHKQSFYKGESPASRRLYEEAAVVAGTPYSVVLYGESGTGKEVIAQTIHELSPRAGKPFVALDCGTLSRELAGSELFGHVKGAFTGALQDKEGHFEMAEGGTLFLDEIGNLSLEVQAALLRVIQERKYKRVGGNKEIPADVRIIVASNENLKEAYIKGRFREDLYHRFNEFSIYLPPLRERKEDILPLAHFFLEQSCSETGKTIPGFEEEVLQIFMQYPWPGNLREYKNVIRRAVLLTPHNATVGLQTLPAEIRTPADPLLSVATEAPTDMLRAVANKAELDVIMQVLKQVNFNKKKAAEILKIDRKTLYNKLKNLHSIDPA